METTLRMFYARAIPLALALATGLFLLVVIVGTAAAQEPGPVTVDQIAAPVAEEGYTGLAGLAESALAGAAALLTTVIGGLLVTLWRQIPEGIRAVIEHVRANTSLKDTTDTAAWHKSLQDLSQDGILAAAAALGMDPKSIQSYEEKNAFLRLAGAFVGKFDSDIKALIDKDGDGIPDVVQVALAKIAPHTITIPKPELAQGFMAAPEPQPRGVKARDADKAMQAFAAKYAPTRKPKGTVTQ